MGEIWVTAIATVAAAGIGAASASHQAKKARRANARTLADAEGAGAFEPLALPEPQELDVPSAEEIMAHWRGEVTTKFPEYEGIAGKLNTSEQAAARAANLAANPMYYDVLNRVTTNAQQAASGAIPKDVQANIKRTANEDAYLKGFNYGAPGGRSGAGTFAGGNDAAANLALRNIGLTSLDIMKYGNQLSGNVLEQSRASRGEIISAKDVIPNPALFQDQMNASAIAEYNFASDKAAFKAGSQNAPIQAAYNKLALQMGVNSQNSALAAQTSAQNTQLAISALQALGQNYNGGTIGSGAKKTPSTGGDTYMAGTSYQGIYPDYGDVPSSSYNGFNYNSYGKPVSDAATIQAI